jgi:hypothetical protein
VLKLVIKKFIGSRLFSFLIIDVKILSNFQKEWCTLVEKKHLKKMRIVHFQGFSTLNMQKDF